MDIVNCAVSELSLCLLPVATNPQLRENVLVAGFYDRTADKAQATIRP
jgi:hypothetical protein